MKNTLKLAAIAALTLGTAIPATHAALHINISNDESGNNVIVTFSGSDAISVPYSYKDIKAPYYGHKIPQWHEETYFYAKADDGGGTYSFSGATSEGAMPGLADIPIPFPGPPEGGATAGFEFGNGKPLDLHSGPSEQEGVVNWDSWFIIPQSVAKMGLVEGTSGEVFYYDANGSLITSIGWSVGSSVPEPATYAAISGLVIAGATLALRRRKEKIYPTK